MANDFIKVEIDLGGALKRLQELEGRSTDLSPVMGTVAETIISGIEDNFAREEGPGGRPWADLAPETKEERRELGYWPGKILQRSGQLAGALQPFHSSREAGVSVAKRYAAIHQFGGTSDMPPGPRGVPARPYLYISAETADEIEATIEDYLD